MTTQKAEDIKDTALELNKIRIQNPEDYFYLKGWIHCLLQNDRMAVQPRKPPTKLEEEKAAV